MLARVRTAGIILRAVDHMVGEPGCPERVDDLLERAAQTLPDVHHRDEALAMMLRRYRDPAAQAEVWRRRVAVFTEAAAATDIKILRAVRLRDALQRAEDSGNPTLREGAAALLQSLRRDDLERMSFRATSRHYEEEFERQIAAASDGSGWREALITFATFGPLSGDTSRNRSSVADRHQLHPLAALFPVQLLGPDGLPAYTGTTPEDRFDVDLTQQEVTLIRFWSPVMSGALHKIPRRHGLPGLAELTVFLEGWPAVAPRVAAAIARCLLRFWTGDSEAAAYTVLPRIETLIRDLVRSTQSGIYRLQRQHKPGQYAGLGQLVPILQEEFDLEESRTRFL